MWSILVNVICAWKKMCIMQFGGAIFCKCHLGLDNVIWAFYNFRFFLSKFSTNNEKRVLKFSTMIIDLSILLSALLHEF